MTEQRIKTAPSSATDLSDEDVLELLPWYATGKTTPAETAAIDRKLAQSPQLQAELALVRSERQVARQDADALGAPPAAVFEKIKSQLDNTRQLPPLARDGRDGAATSVGGFLARLFGFLPAPALRLALIVACLAVVVEGAALWRLGGGGSETGGTYQTASVPAAATGPELIVQFQPEAGIAAIGGAISDLGAGIVRGPMPDGAYVIALPAGADADAAIAKLRGLTALVANVDRGS